MPFLLAVVKHIDAIGDAKIEDVLDDYIAFYQDRLALSLIHISKMISNNTLEKIPQHLSMMD